MGDDRDTRPLGYVVYLVGHVGEEWVLMCYYTGLIGCLLVYLVGHVGGVDDG